MYAFIRGKVEYKDRDTVVLDASGVGYEILASTRTLGNLPAVGEIARVHTYLHVREDAMQLFGFDSREEKSMFLRLLGVTGVGPKLAMAILGGMSVGELAVALVSRDARAISRIPGVGKKTAERLILELREGVAQEELTAGASSGGAGMPVGGGAAAEAISGLMALGFSSIEATKAVNVAGDVGSAEEIIMRALKALDRR